MPQAILERELRPGPRFQQVRDYHVGAVLSDVDGTIVRERSFSMPSLRISRAFRDTGEKVPTGLSTARPLPQVEQLTQHLKLSGLSILSNGAQVFDARTGLMVIDRYMKPETAIEITKALQRIGIAQTIQDGGYDFRWAGLPNYAPALPKHGLGFYRLFEDVKGYSHTIIDVASYAPYKPYMIILNDLDNGRRKVVEDIVSGSKDPNVKTYIANESGGKFDVFIADRRANKLTALHEISEMNDILEWEHMVMGNGNFDKEIIEKAGVGVAVANAVQSVKNGAVFIAPSMKDNGPAVALEELVLKKSK